MHRVPTRRSVDQRPVLAAAGPPPVHPIVAHLPQRTHPVVREPVRGGVIHGLEDQLLDLGGDPRRERAVQPQPDLPRITASSIACALTASVNSPISTCAASSSQFRSLAGRPGPRASAASAAS